MLQTIGNVLYIDPQAEIPLGFCPECGGELFGSSPCPRCGKEDSHDPA